MRMRLRTWSGRICFQSIILLLFFVSGTNEQLLFTTLEFGFLWRFAETGAPFHSPPS